jgi:hypothetical protein
LSKAEKKMRESGLGEFNLEDRTQRTAYIAATQEEEEPPVAVTALSPGAGPADRREYIAARLSGAEAVEPVAEGE